MTSRLVEIITAQDPAVRNTPLEQVCQGLTTKQLLAECAALDAFRRQASNLYERVRACFFLYALHRFRLEGTLGNATTHIPFDSYTYLLERRFEESIDTLLAAQAANGPSDALSSALAEAYHALGFQHLANQVKKSVRSVRGNQWIFRMGHPLDHPLRFRPEMLQRDTETGLYPLLVERTPVRMDLSHSGWSDIFFLGMDYPEGARVLNVSIDLGVHGRDPIAAPPVEAYLRVIDEPLIRLCSVDLGARADITSLDEIFDYARDYLGLLKAGIIAAGIVPPGIEGAEQPLSELLVQLVGPGKGIELVSRVRDIPKGSRLAVSTNLLAAIITTCMRATGQTVNLRGGLQDGERRTVAARAILGEWLGGSGGGWQDSGGVWPGIKLIEGVRAAEGDPEYGTSRGCLLPQHTILGRDRVPESARQALQDSLVLVHGGMAQNVGPILEMVTERYLLRSHKEWKARQQAMSLFDSIVGHLERGDIRGLGQATAHNFASPIQDIIPWASNLYTEELIARVKARFGADYWGFWMLGGMSGGGMGFIVDPKVRLQAQEELGGIMLGLKRELEQALPFAMDPVVYDMSINDYGTMGEIYRGSQALLPNRYYDITSPGVLSGREAATDIRRNELAYYARHKAPQEKLAAMMQSLAESYKPAANQGQHPGELDNLLHELGFDEEEHRVLRQDLQQGRIGLAQNRLPVNTQITDVREGDVLEIGGEKSASLRALGLQALHNQSVAVVTLAGGVGSRWTQGAGVVKALSPFCRFGSSEDASRHRSFIEVHLAKSRQTAELAACAVPHIITTSYLTHPAISATLEREQNYGYDGPLYLSRGQSVGLRLIPMTRDLRFAWEEMPQQLLDEQAQKVRDSQHNALIAWARAMGEGTDYQDNLPLQCINPVGHWYEVPNLLLSGTLNQLLQEHPTVQYLMVHNIDTVGTNVDAEIVGTLLEQQADWAVEVIPRLVHDRGGGLARVNGKLRLVEGLAMPREEVEFQLTYYNTNTFWLNVDALLRLFGLDRETLGNVELVRQAVRTMARRVPTYITLKDVKKRWGHGQEDVYPVAQYEKLWGDMTGLPEVQPLYLHVDRNRGQQLKEQAQRDGWYRDGSKDYVESLCLWR